MEYRIPKQVIVLYASQIVHDSFILLEYRFKKMKRDSCLQRREDVLNDGSYKRND